MARILVRVCFVFSSLMTIFTMSATADLPWQQSIPLRVVFFAPKNDTSVVANSLGFWPNAGALNIGAERVANESIFVNLTLPASNDTYHIQLLHRDGRCNAIETVREAQRLVENRAADVFIGPACSGASIPLNIFAEANRIPHILWLSGAAELSDRRTYPHVIRPVQNYFLAGACVANFLQNKPFNWNRVAVVTQSDYYLCGFFSAGLPLNRYFNAYASEGDEELNMKTDGRFRLAGEHSVLKGTSDEAIDAILDKLSRQARIILTCFWEDVPDVSIRFMLRAQQRQMLMPGNGYVWLTFTFQLDEPYKPPYMLRAPAGPHAASLTESLRMMNLPHLIGQESQILESFQSVIEISWYVKAGVEFRREVYENLAKLPWNYTAERLASEKPSTTISTGGTYSAHLADSVYLYALAVREALREGVDYRDSAQMYRLMKTVRFSGTSGEFALNSDGERLPNLIFKGPAASYGIGKNASFTTKGVLSCSLAPNSTTVLVPHYDEIEPLVWWSGGKADETLTERTTALPPPDAPPCGFFNQHCRSSLTAIIVPCVVAFIFAVCCVTAAVWYYRRTAWQRNLLLMTWKLAPGDIEIVENYRLGVSSSRVGNQQSGSLASFYTLNSTANLSIGSTIMLGGVPAVVGGGRGKSRRSTVSSGRPLTRGFADNDVTTTNAGQHATAVLVKVRGGKLSQLYCLRRSSPAGEKRSEMYRHSATGGKSRLFGGGGYTTETLELLHFMKQNMQHDNVSLFIGACFDVDEHDTNTKLRALTHGDGHGASGGVLIYELSGKGTLADMLENDEFALDWLFQLSFATDIVEGLYYLHTSASPSLKFHGCLRSDLIGIDQRCTAKLTCYGAWRFGLDNARMLYETKQYAKLFYTAPELIGEAARSMAVDDEKEEVVEKKPEDLTRNMQQADIYSCAMLLYELMYRECISCDSFIAQNDRVKLVDPDVRTNFDVIQILSTETADYATVRPEMFTTGDENAAQTVAIGRGTSHSNQNSGAVTSDMATQRAATAQLQSVVRASWQANPLARPNAGELRKTLRSINALDGGGGGASFVDRIITRMESYSQNLEALVNARTNELSEEQKRSDMLLSEILPPTVVQQLKSGRSVEPELFDSTTVYFSDIVQFTVIAARLSPMGVVELLNKLFVQMDEHIGQYAAYKVETIGDAYMVVSGLPERRNDHVIQICLMARSIQASIGQVRVPTSDNKVSAESEPVRVRIGINSGPCVAGVVGVKMPRYCLFGDTVNVASRMESHGEPMRIHISHSTMELLMAAVENSAIKSSLFKIEPRGEVEIKGKGIMLTYWLE